MLATLQTATAQSYLTQIGVPPFTTALPIENGFINVANGNLHLSIPSGSFPERGSHPFVAGLVYDSRIWQVVSGTSNSWQPTNAGSQGGWRFVTSGDAGNASFTSYGDRYGAGITSATWIDPLGTVHYFPVSLALSSNGNCVDSSSAVFATDATGYYTSWTHSCSNNSLYHYFYSPDGTVVNRGGPGYASAPEDTNGNYFTADANGNVIDTLGRTPITYVASGTGCSTNYCYNILNSQGSTSQIKITTTTVYVNTAFGQSGVTEYSGSFTAIQSITLPDGNSYTFGYDSGTTSGHYGGLTSITLPTGGQITYGYTTYQDSFGNRNQWVNSRAISGGGTWSYTPAVISTCGSGQVGCQQKVTVTKPSTDQMIYTFILNNGAWKSQVQAYTGSTTLLSTVSNAWDFSQSCSPQPCTGAFNVRVLTTTTTLPTPGANNVTSQTKLTYNDANTMNVASIKAWKFYAGTSPTFPATSDRETDFTYLATSAYTAKNIVNRVLSTTVKDGTGALVAQTNFTYDDSGALQNSSPATGIFQHDDTNYGLTNTVRGNLTTISRCTNPSSCSSSPVKTTMIYDTTGQLLSVTDPNTNVTSFNYADNFFKDVGDGPSNPPQAYSITPVVTNAYVKTVTPPAIPASTFGYYYHTGQLASSKDANGNTSYSHFFDTPFSRPTSVVLPDGGWSYTAYSAAETQVDAYVGITGAFATSGCTGCRQDEAALDNLGRVITQKLMSDPDGITTVTTNYDTTGRVLNVSHPARTTASTTDGIETPTYDGLGRVIKTTHQDNTFSQVFYGAAVSGSGVNTTQLCSSGTYGLGYPVLFVDEASNKRETWTDGLGKTIEADEPDSSGNLTSNTCYKNDGLGNLLQIVHGAQTRTYVYDTLSRPTSVTIPELANSSGSNCAVNYTYDSNSNILTQTAPAPNQTSCTGTVTITHYYDALNRLTKKTYSDSSPTVQYGFDGAALTGCTTTPPTLTITNPKGRRTSMCDSSGAASWSYDSMGRVLIEARTILGVTKNTSYSYNRDGSIARVTYPSNNMITYTVSNAQRLTAAKDVANNVQFATAASYVPPGRLSGVITGQISGGFAGISESHSFNNRLEYTSTYASSTAGTALNLTYCYNGFDFTNGCSSSAAHNNGSVTGITSGVDSNRTMNSQYDSLNRISSADSKATSGVDCWGQNFIPDAVANLNTITSAQCSSGSLSVTVDANNHIINDSTFAYDASGNMTKDGSGTGYLYTFDDDGHLTLAAGQAGGPYCYVYDGNGLRVAKKSSATTCASGTVTKLYWRSITGRALAETDGSGSTANSAYYEYVFFGGRRIAQRTGPGAIFYYFADQLGSTRTITTGSGTGQTPGQLCYDADFTPYGQEMQHTERLQTTACPPNYRFTGYERDSETGLDYAFARYYSSRLGRFLSTDPLAGTAGPQSLNAYAYVINDPLNVVDPSGMDGCPPNAPPGTICGPPSSVWDDHGSVDLAAMTGVGGSGEIAIEEARYESIITTGWDPVLEIQYYEYEFTGVDRSTKVEQQKELAAIQLGQAKCAGQSRDAIADCILDAYNTLFLKTPKNKDSPLVGGNYNFDSTQVVIQGDHISGGGLGCVWGRCGIIDSLHFHSDGTFHVDSANPWFIPIGSAIHLGVDIIGGNSWWSQGIPRP